MQLPDIKELQAKLAKQRNEVQQLKSDNDKLNNLLMDINKKLEESEKFKTHFISNVTNELINPFTSITCLAQSILSAHKMDWKRIISMVALIHSETFTLELQLKNILNAARLEAGIMHLSPEKADIQELINSLRDFYHHELLKRKIDTKITFHADAARNNKKYFITDMEKLNIILNNVFNNAIKFSNDNAVINIDTCMHTDKLSVEISDVGIGIPEKQIERIFDRFERLDNEINSVTPGQGLGLSICKGIIDLFEGEIKVSGNQHGGASFTVIIPEQNAVPDAFATDTNEIFFDIEEVF